MKKLKLGLCLVLMFFAFSNLFAQDPPPNDGTGLYLDEVPIAGEIYFVLAALGVGGFILLRKQKRQNSV